MIDVNVISWNTDATANIFVLFVIVAFDFINLWLSKDKIKVQLLIVEILSFYGGFSYLIIVYQVI